MGYYHVGVCKALISEGLLPRVISGASAGSIMAAGIGYGDDMFICSFVLFGHSSRTQRYICDCVMLCCFVL